MRAHAKDLGEFYTGYPLQVADVIASVSQRIAYQWDVSLASAETIALALGLQHFDVCRIVPRTGLDQTKAVKASRPVASTHQKEEALSLPRAEINRKTSTNPLKAEFDRLAKPYADISRLSNRLKETLDRLAMPNPLQEAVDRVAMTNPLQETVNRLVKANPARTALDELAKANPMQAELDRLAKTNLAQAALDELAKANLLQAELDRLGIANQSQWRTKD